MQTPVIEIQTPISEIQTPSFQAVEMLQFPRPWAQGFSTRSSECGGSGTTCRAPDGTPAAMQAWFGQDMGVEPFHAIGSIACRPNLGSDQSSDLHARQDDTVADRSEAEGGYSGTDNRNKA